MTAIRERLPDRRACLTFDFECQGQHYTASIGHYDDGRLAEIFISNGHANSAVDTAARDSAITCSIALQFGADPEAIRRALCRDSRGIASGPLAQCLDILAAEATP